MATRRVTAHASGSVQLGAKGVLPRSREWTRSRIGPLQPFGLAANRTYWEMIAPARSHVLKPGLLISAHLSSRQENYL